MGRLTAGLLMAAPAASVINVASMYGIVASRTPMAAYNATKAPPAPRVSPGEDLVATRGRQEGMALVNNPLFARYFRSLRAWASAS
jgi:hypothetical protein